MRVRDAAPPPPKSRRRGPFRSSLRVALIALAGAAYLVISSFTRVAIAAKALSLQLISLAEVPRVMLTGLGYDLIAATYIVAPLALYLALIPTRWLVARAHLRVLLTIMGIGLFGAVGLAIAEYRFFTELNTRFNFLLVQHLLNAHPLPFDMWDAPSIAWTLLVCAAVTLAVVLRVRPHVRELRGRTRHASGCMPHAIGLVLAAFVFHLSVDIDRARTHRNAAADEIAANGLYSFADAISAPRMEYAEIYPTLEEREAAVRVRRLLAQQNARFIPGSGNPIYRHVSNTDRAKLLHVIVVVEESLRSDFVGAYGDTRGLTPNLDRMARESVVFSKTYASSTRSARGLEAITASFPPVPPRPIFERGHDQALFNWSTVMRNAGYTPTFIYGGDSKFENMHAYFARSGYRVIDSSNIDQPTFTNVWGVSDGDLFSHALRVFDTQHENGERIFSVIMTTSNQTPFTFPRGIPGVAPKGGGPEAGARYADYALGRFMEDLKTKPYFSNTAVVVVGDRGLRRPKTERDELRGYAVPFLVYSPANFQPQRSESASSQLDVAPTVLGLLGISYDSTFFGRDALIAAPAKPVVPISDELELALLEGSELYHLAFRRLHRGKRSNATPADAAAELKDEGSRDAAAYFQLAASLYERRQYHVP